MKVEILEYDGCFAIQATADTAQEAALLTRFGMNATKEVRSMSTSATRNGQFGFSVVFGKHARAADSIPRRK